MTPKESLLKKWVPELNSIPSKLIHEPWNMTLMEQSFYGVLIGENYPFPIVNLEISSKMREKKFGNTKNILL